MLTVLVSPLAIPLTELLPISLSVSYQKVKSAEASPCPEFFTYAVITTLLPSLGLLLLKSICVISRSASAVTISKLLRVTLPFVELETENLVSTVSSFESESTRVFSLFFKLLDCTFNSKSYSIFKLPNPTLPSLSLVTVNMSVAISTPYSSTYVSSLSIA